MDRRLKLTTVLAIEFDAEGSSEDNDGDRCGLAGAVVRVVPVDVFVDKEEGN